MTWFSRKKEPIGKNAEKRSIPDGLFVKCEGCGETIYKSDFEKTFMVCPKCDKHHTMPAKMRIELLIDDGTFEEKDAGLTSTDPLKFRDSKKYKDRIKAAQKNTAAMEAIICGSGRLGGWAVEMCSFEFGFLGGSMGAVVGEKIARAADRAIEHKRPLISVSCSGGARMQEGMHSLMQMAKTAASIGMLGEAGLPYVSILAHPTAGGVTASFAMLGDVILAEPDALICFAGPRVIEQTIKQKLPEGFQRAEFLLERGFVDYIVKRNEMKGTLETLINHMSAAIPLENRPPKKAEESVEAGSGAVSIESKTGESKTDSETSDVSQGE